MKAHCQPWYRIPCLLNSKPILYVSDSLAVDFAVFHSGHMTYCYGSMRITQMRWATLNNQSPKLFILQTACGYVISTRGCVTFSVFIAVPVKQCSILLNAVCLLQHVHSLAPHSKQRHCATVLYVHTVISSTHTCTTSIKCCSTYERCAA